MKIRTALALLLSLSAASVLADLMHRAPTPQEKAAMQKALAAITKVIDRFGNADWTVVSESRPRADSVAAEPSSPVDAPLGFNRKYGIRDGSPLYKAKVLPAIEAVRKAMKANDYAGATKAGEVTNGTMDFIVDTYVNRIDVPTGARATNLAANGASLAYEIRDPRRGGAYTVIVGVGDWGHAKGTGSLIAYRFKNRKGTAHVENVVFTFVTARDAGFAADRIREIVRTTDWGELARGLTP